MALVQVTLAKGRTRDQLHALSGALTDEVEELLGSRRESIR
jgi:Tautomerase enzyme